MKVLSIRDIIGPVMIGPSSSHTAGALRIALMARRLVATTPASVHFTLYGSFAHTYKGHGTDRALVAGILGFEPDDARIKDSFSIAKQSSLQFDFTLDEKTHTNHPNTVDISIVDTRGTQVDVRGESIGGGEAQIVGINGVEVVLTGQYHSIVVKQLDTSGVLAFIAQSLSDYGVNIATTRLFRERKGDIAYTIMETDDEISPEITDILCAHENIFEARIIPSDRSSEALAPKSNNSEGHTFATSSNKSDSSKGATFEKYNFENAAQLLEICSSHNISISEAMLLREEGILADNNIVTNDTENYLNGVLEVMRNAIFSAIDEPKRSMGGLIGGEAARLAEGAGSKGVSGSGLEGPSPSYVGGAVFDRAITYAMATLETNATMGCIVAAPTAGSSGVVPGVLFAHFEDAPCTQNQKVHALANAAAVGYIISRNATVSGAEGGCQAEVGSASAMAASAVCELLGGTPSQCLSAAASALAGLLGLVCDPIAGLVEAPCQTRNATGAANALACAQMALAGVGSVVPLDEMVDAMYQVGRSLPFELRESALGGMAATPTACSMCKACK